MPTRLEKIMELIKKEAEKVPNPDPVLRLYNISMQIQNKIIEEMERIREQERNATL